MATEIIAAFVDKRNGRRYAPGDMIDPALTPDQIMRLTKAGCLTRDDAEGDAPAGRRRRSAA